MPELPEVETVRRGLNQVSLNQTIQGGQVLLERTIAHPVLVADFLPNLQGWAIVQWHRRGKYLLAELCQSPQQQEGTETHPKKLPTPHFQLCTSNPALSTCFLGVHLRMTGQLLWVDRSESVQKHTRVRLFFDDGKELRFVDQRTFGQMWWVPGNQPPEQVMTGLQQLGPEPFSSDFSTAYFTQQLAHRRRPIKNALLDQTIVAGIGNIYADEALFMSQIHPQVLCPQLTSEQIERLHGNIQTVLQESIDVGGTTISTFRTVTGLNGNYGGVARVYARDGAACHTCGSVIQRLKLAGRSAHFCPTCQQ